MSQNSLTPSEEQLLESLVVGNLEPGSVEVRRQAQLSGAFRARLESFLKLREDLEEAAADQSATLHAASELEGTPGEESLLATLGLEVPAPRSSVRRPMRAWYWVATVAAGLFVVLALRLSQGDDKEPVIFMGPGLQLTVEDQRTMLWSLGRDGALGVEYHVTLRSADGAASSGSPLEFRTSETQWELSPDIRARFPGPFWIHVIAHSNSGVELGQGLLRFDPSQQ